MKDMLGGIIKCFTEMVWKKMNEFPTTKTISWR